MKLGKSDDLQNKQEFVNTFINTIYVFNDKTLIYLNIGDSGTNDIVTFEEMQKDIETISYGSDIKGSAPPKNLFI